MNHTTTSNKAYYAQVIFLALVIGIGLQIAQAWSTPTEPAPGGNVGAPITTSNVDQVKSAGLGVTNLLATGIVQTGGLKLTTGAGAGKVLMSDEDGNASWVDEVQKRIVGSCTVPGQAITGINADGTVVCGGVSGPTTLDLYNGLHSSTQCSAIGGVVYTIGSDKFCKISRPFPSLSGWTYYLNWSDTTVRTCAVRRWTTNPSGQCNPCTTGSHVWANTPIESCSQSCTSFDNMTMTARTYTENCGATVNNRLVY